MVSSQISDRATARSTLRWGLWSEAGWQEQNVVTVRVGARISYLG